ncbi:MAG: hypothetical protein KJ893_09520 [Candidatus Omnitrophica bacterium]|nr:hypothetical protein [Candidatus Omnitrophota bacterium]MBU4478472.1 hypothetical protein [Candidatus Omnitrophota bacterium]MCG2703773.1 hypothetical protein [Candidatus Omnitrophota bacterium]
MTEIICPYCGVAVTISQEKTEWLTIAEKNCWHCHNPIVFECPLCRKQDTVDCFDAYDMLHNDIPICKTCKQNDLTGRYAIYKKYKWTKNNVVDLLIGIINSDSFKLITVCMAVIFIASFFPTYSFVVALGAFLLLVIFAYIKLILKAHNARMGKTSNEHRQKPGEGN